MTTSQLTKWGIVFLLGYYLLQTVWGEKMPANKGTGWDGFHYTMYALDYSGHLKEGKFRTERVQKSLPSIIIYYTHSFLGIKHTIPNVIKSFQVYNYILIFLSLFLWLYICRIGGFKDITILIGYISFFINYAFFDYVFYYPCLTDVSTMFLSMLMLLFYLKHKNWLIFFIALVGGFVNPLLHYSGLLLFFFGTKPSSLVQTKRSLIFAILLATAGVFLVGSAIVFSLIKDPKDLGDPLIIFQLIIGSAFVAVYIFSVIFFLTHNDSFYNFKEYAYVKMAGKFVLAIAWYALHAYIIDAISNKTGWNFRRILYSIWPIRGVFYPLEFMVGHFVFFGPLVLGICLLWKKYAKQVQSLGVGVTVVFIANLMYGLDSETRHSLLQIFPFIVFFFLKVIDSYEIQPKGVLTYFLISLPLTKFWLTHNTANFPESSFTSIGEYMEFEWYLAQLPLFLGGLAFFYYKRNLFLTRDQNTIRENH